MPGKLHDRVAIITGSSSGIGAQIATHFAKLGAKLSLAGRNEAGLKKIQEDCILAGAAKGDVIYTTGDITDDNCRQQLVANTLKHFNKVDILVNNAGMVVMSADCATGTLDELQKMMDCNLYSAIRMSQICLPHLEKVKGNIVNIGSITGLRPHANVGMYCLSKIAVNHLTQCLAYEVGSRGIRVNSINPAAVDTPILDIPGLSDEMKHKYLDTIGATYPLGRVGKPMDIAHAVAFLANNDEADWITGTLLAVDGGYVITNGSQATMKAFTDNYNK